MKTGAVVRWLAVLAMLFSLCTPLAWSKDELISLEMQNIHLTDAVRNLAKFLNITVVVSQRVQGAATLQLHEVKAQHAFEMLLLAHGLSAWRVGKIWYIAPREELLKRKQDEMAWQLIQQESAPLFTHMWQIRYARVEDIARILQDDQASLLSKRGRVRIDARTNILYIQDIVSHIEAARHLINRLDVPVQQIAIEARLASVDSDFERELGVHFAIKPQLADNGAVFGVRSALEEQGKYSLAVAKLADGSLLDVKLSALEKAGHAELISSPSLFTTNQQPASIEAGEEVPYQEVSESGGTAVVFKKAVLGLKVIPQILPGNNVLLQLQINQDRPSHRMVQGVPTISTRQMKTSVLVKNGQTMVLGGIYETNEERGQLRLPFISQVPLIGLLFKQQSKRENKRELLIFVTPKIIAQET